MKVYELLDAPEKWTQGESALDADGQIRDGDELGVVCWCLEAALRHCYPEDWVSRLMSLQHRLGKAAYHWNDDPERTFEDVRTLALELDI